MNDQYLSLFSEPGSNSVAIVAVDMLQAQLRAISVSIADPSFTPRKPEEALDFPRLFGNQLDDLREFVKASLSNDIKPVVIVAANPRSQTVELDSPLLLDLASPLVATLLFLTQEGACAASMILFEGEISTKVLLGFEHTADPIVRSLMFGYAPPRLVPEDICRSYAAALFGEEQISPIHIAYIAVEIETDELARIFLGSDGEVQSSHDIVSFLNKVFISEDEAKQSVATLKRQECEGVTSALDASSSHVKTPSDEWLALQLLAQQFKRENRGETVVSGTEAFSIWATSSTPYDDFKLSVPLRYAISQRKHASIGGNNARKIALLDICRTLHLRLKVSSLFYDLHANELAYRLASQYDFDDLALPTLGAPDAIAELPVSQIEQLWAKMLIDMRVYEWDATEFFHETLARIADGQNICIEKITFPLWGVLGPIDEMTLFSPSEDNQVSLSGVRNDFSAHMIKVAERYRGWRLSPRYIFETLGRLYHQALRAERDKDFDTAIKICQKAIEYAKNHPPEKILSLALSRLFDIFAQLWRLIVLRSSQNLTGTGEFAELANAIQKQLPDLDKTETRELAELSILKQLPDLDQKKDELIDHLKFALALCDNLLKTSFDPCVNDKRIEALCLLSSLLATTGRREECDQILAAALSLISSSPAGKIRYTHLIPLAMIKITHASRVVEDGDGDSAEMIQLDNFLKEALECVEAYETRGVSESSQRLRSLISLMVSIGAPA